MDRRKKRAYLFAFIALLLGLIPIAGRLWLEKFGAKERPELGVVGQFVYYDESNQSITRDQLRRAMTVVINWPRRCMEDGCPAELDHLEKVEQWINQELSARWSEDKNPLFKVLVGEGLENLKGFKDWRRFPVAVLDGTLLPKGADTSRPIFVVIDHDLQFAESYDLSEPTRLEELGRTLSKITFDQYLGNYLSKRTFMGPRRTHAVN